MSHTDSHLNTKKCLNVLPEIKQEMKQLLEPKSKAKAKKTVDMEEIRAELRGTMGGRHHTIIDEEEEEEEEGDEDVYMYPADMHPMSEMNIEKQYVHQKLVNGTEKKLKDL